MDENKNESEGEYIKITANQFWWWLISFFLGWMGSDMVFTYNPEIYIEEAPGYFRAKLMSVIAGTIIVRVITAIFIEDRVNKLLKKWGA